MTSPISLSSPAGGSLAPHASWAHWAAFALAAALLLAIDLGVFRHEPREPSTKEALAWSAAWAALAAAFGAGVTATMGRDKGLQFFTGYAVEQALSVDNLFVMMLVFAQFGVPRAAQRRVLVWGILGAVVLRGAMVFAGVALVARFHALTYALGALLLVAAAKVLREALGGASPPEAGAGAARPPHGARIRRALERLVPVARDDISGKFIVVRRGAPHATTLLLALVTIEIADAIFALDSIPAVLAVSTDPFVVLTSNVFAVLGLRSLYFALVGLLDRLAYLKHGLAAVLAVVGLKMLGQPFFRAPEWLTLGLVALILAASAVASLLALPTRERNEDGSLES